MMTGSMSISLLFGVFVSTLLTLLVIPLGCVSLGERIFACAGSNDPNACDDYDARVAAQNGTVSAANAIDNSDDGLSRRITDDSPTAGDSDTTEDEPVVKDEPVAKKKATVKKKSTRKKSVKKKSAVKGKESPDKPQDEK